MLAFERQGVCEMKLLSLENNGDCNLREFRNALGSFATGVTIVTTNAGNGAPVGVTVNSFASVSLSPPLVLWSLLSSSPSMSAFAGAMHFAVNILAENQKGLAQRFASPIADKFVGVSWAESNAGMPLIDGCIARLHCRKMFQYYGGDHVIFVGAVESFDYRPAKALLFLQGRFWPSEEDERAGREARPELVGSVRPREKSGGPQLQGDQR